MPLRLIFMGTPDFAVPVLEAFIKAGDEIACVYSQPPRPAGRGHRLTPSPVQAAAERHGIMARHPTSLKTPEAQAEFAALKADAAVVVAYGLLLPQAVLDAPRLGCFNLHASLLPRWRGAAPIQRAVEAGDAQTGITIMQMDAGLDTGDMLLVEPIAIAPDDSAGTLHDRLAALGARLVVQALEQSAQGILQPRPQPMEGITYAHKIDKQEAALDWRLPAAVLERRIRAFDPFPGASGRIGGETLKIWRARPEPGHAAAPGCLLAADADGLLVACGEGALRLTQLQRPGGRRLAAAELLRGFALRPGQVFESDA